MASVIADAGLRLPQGAPVFPETSFGTAGHPPIVWQAPRIESWADFRAARHDRPLLQRLDEYENSLLISGCDWPSTTAVVRLLQRTGGFADHGFGYDDELDGALLLAGYVTRFSEKRHCFQTTYVTSRFTEYFEHNDFTLVWILREPHSVVASLLSRWRRNAIDPTWPGNDADAPAARSPLLVESRVDKACAAYTAAVTRAFPLYERLGRRLAIVDYDDLAASRERLLPPLCEFARAPFDAHLLRHLHGRHVHRGPMLARWEAARVDELAAPVYWRARALCAIGTGHAC